MKTQHKLITLTVLIVAASGLLLSACSSETSAISAAQTNPTSGIETELPETETAAVSTESISTETTSESETIAVEEERQNTSASGLTQAEIDNLLFMREEEKLAQDVYLALYAIWGMPIFDNIAGSEQTHTEAVKRLLDKYNLPDPADTSSAGVFVNPDLQQLYDDLTETGKASLSAALKVGAAIEEIDILDLQSALEETDKPDIERVYQNLLKGSENHLRAFTRTLSRQTDETYQPQYLSQSAYDAIVSDGNAQGGGNGRGGGRRP